VLTTAHPHFGAFNIVMRDPKFSPYLYLTLESAVAAASNATFGQPAWRAGLKYAAPFFRAPALPAPPAANPVVAIAAEPDAAASPAAPDPQAIAAGEKIYATNCAACHNAAGTGGIGPNLHATPAHMSLAQTITFIEKPPAGTMPKLFPAPLSDAQVRQVAAYIRSAFH